MVRFLIPLLVAGCAVAQGSSHDVVSDTCDCPTVEIPAAFERVEQVVEVPRGDVSMYWTGVHVPADSVGLSVNMIWSTDDGEVHTIPQIGGDEQQQWRLIDGEVVLGEPRGERVFVVSWLQ